MTLSGPFVAEEIEGPSSYPLVTNQNGSPTRKSSPTKVLQLAVDEDNYLAPHSTNPVMYTDLSDKGETPIGQHFLFQLLRASRIPA